MLRIEGIPNESVLAGDGFEITVRDEKSGAEAIRADWKYDKDMVDIIENVRDGRYVYTVLTLKPGLTKISASIEYSSTAFFIRIVEWRHREIE